MLALCCLLVSSCDGCAACGGSSEVLAVLSSVSQSGVTRDKAADPEVWRPARLEDEFLLGDGLRTDADGKAMLTLAGTHELRVPERTIIRFVGNTERGRRFEVETGSAVFRARGSDLRLWTALGPAVLQQGSELRVERTKQAVGYVVEVGAARFLTEDGERELVAGQRYEIGIGEAVLRAIKPHVSEGDGAVARTPAVSADAAAAESDASARAEVRSAGEDDAAEYSPGLDHRSLVLSSGRSATIHAARPPVAVGLDVAELCPDEAAVRLGPRRSLYHGRAVVSLPVDVGLHRYRVYCLQDGVRKRAVVATGRIRVLRDAGRQRLPRRPPETNIDTDGRKYKVIYQNQPPTIAVRWPRPPEAASYTLNVDGKRRKVRRPRHTFSSGALSDGTHEVSFEAAGRRSRTTEIRVRFDSAATTASLSAPDDETFAPGETVHVTGLALRGWKVTAERGTIGTRTGQRFEGQVTTSAEHPDVAIRLSHPRLGTHYYVRRSVRSQ